MAPNVPMSRGALRTRQRQNSFSAVCSRVAYSDQERPWRSYLLPAGEGAPQGRMRDEMLALAQYRSSKEKKTAFAATLGEIANPGIQTGQLFTSPIPSTNGIEPWPANSPHP